MLEDIKEKVWNYYLEYGLISISLVQRRHKLTYVAAQKVCQWVSQRVDCKRIKINCKKSTVYPFLK